MMTTHGIALTVLLCLPGAACAFGTETRQQASPDATGEWEWVYVAGLENPALSPEADRALSLLGEALGREGIRWVAAGSRGYSLSIDSRDLPRGREIVQAVVDRHRLPVGVAGQ